MTCCQSFQVDSNFLHETREPIFTPYYRTIVESECNLEREFTYDPYMIFVLKTNLLPLLPGYDLNFPTIIKNDKLYLTISPTIGGDVAILTDLEYKRSRDKVDEITAKPLTHVLLVDSKNNFVTSKYVISKNWIQSILPYLEVAIELNPIITNDGLKISLLGYPDYYDIYHDLIINLTNKIELMYKQGYIVNPPEYVIENWGLTEEDDGLYFPDWTQKELEITYESLSNFLQLRVFEEEYASIFIGTENWVIRHNLARNFASSAGWFHQQDFYFLGEILKIKLDNLTHLRQILALIARIKYNTSGKAAIFLVNSANRLSKFQKIAKDLGYDDVVTYKTDYHDKYFSVMVEPSADVKEILVLFNSKLNE